MPTINRLPKKKKSTYHSDTDMRELRKTAYNTTAWRKLRAAYIKEHPLCENCLKTGKVTPAQNIHHKRSPFIGGTINYELLLDPENLQALCLECHAEHHNRERGYISPIEVLKQLADLLDESITDEELEGK